MASFTDFSFQQIEDQYVSLSLDSEIQAGDYILYSELCSKLAGSSQEWTNIYNTLLAGFETDAEARQSGFSYNVATPDGYVEWKTDRVVFVNQGATILMSPKLYVVSPSLEAKAASSASVTFQVVGARSDPTDSYYQSITVVNWKQAAALLGAGPLKTLLTQDFEDTSAFVSAVLAAGLVMPVSPFLSGGGYNVYTNYLITHSDGTSDIFTLYFGGSQEYWYNQYTNDGFQQKAFYFMLPSQMGSGGGATDTSSGLKVTVTNLTDKAVFLSDIYANIPANGSVEFIRSPSDLPSMYALNKLRNDGVLSAFWVPVES